MRGARTDGSMVTTASTHARGRRRKVLPLLAALSIFASSALVDVVLATRASAATTELYSWGNNSYGQLGDGTTTQSDVPLKVQLPAGVSATAVGDGPELQLGGGHRRKAVRLGEQQQRTAWRRKHDELLRTGRRPHAGRGHRHRRGRRD